MCVYVRMCLEADKLYAVSSTYDGAPMSHGSLK